MSTISVWVLLVFWGHDRSGGPTVIDNIATREECVRVQQVVASGPHIRARCIEVIKALPPRH